MRRDTIVIEPRHICIKKCHIATIYIHNPTSGCYPLTVDVFIIEFIVPFAMNPVLVVCCCDGGGVVVAVGSLLGWAVRDIFLLSKVGTY